MPKPVVERLASIGACPRPRPRSSATSPRGSVSRRKIHSGAAWARDPAASHSAAASRERGTDAQRGSCGSDDTANLYHGGGDPRPSRLCSARMRVAVCCAHAVVVVVSIGREGASRGARASERRSSLLRAGLAAGGARASRRRARRPPPAPAAAAATAPPAIAGCAGGDAVPPPGRPPPPRLRRRATRSPGYPPPGYPPPAAIPGWGAPPRPRWVYVELQQRRSARADRSRRRRRARAGLLRAVPQDARHRQRLRHRGRRRPRHLAVRAARRSRQGDARRAGRLVGAVRGRRHPGRRRRRRRRISASLVWEAGQDLATIDSILRTRTTRASAPARP